jgi:alkanesulfonate monooxygenase SsuD/methylene tetrahydromethanopterin reductase-like flavin-dependent oxidoreductase (luciferase family)
VPLLIAGGGEKVTLRQVAQHADASNIGAGDALGSAWGPDDVRRKYAVLRAHCADVGRPFDSILRSYAFPVQLKTSGPPQVERRQHHRASFEMDHLSATPADVAARCRALVDAGVRYFVVMGLRDTAALRLFAEEVIPAVSQPEERQSSA